MDQQKTQAEAELNPAELDQVVGGTSAATEPTAEPECAKNCCFGAHYKTVTIASREAE